MRDIDEMIELQLMNEEPGDCPRSSPVTWIDPKAEMPDDEIIVLIALGDGEVWTGHHADGKWLFCEGSPVDQGEGTSVEWWADFPLPPNRNEKPLISTNEH